MVTGPDTAAPAASASPCIAPEDPDHWFSTEVHPHQAKLKAYLTHTFPRVRSDVDDVVQESYLRLWKAASRQKIQSAKALLYLVARRVALNFLRKADNAPFDPYGADVLPRVTTDAPDAVESALIQERIGLLADALMSLPPRCREILILCRVKGLTQKEVGDRFGLSERTVEAHVRNGVQGLRTWLRAHGHFPDER